MTFEQLLIVLAGPLSVLAAALIIFALVRWQDAREDRKRVTKRAASHRR